MITRCRVLIGDTVRVRGSGQVINVTLEVRGASRIRARSRGRCLGQLSYIRGSRPTRN